MMIFLSARWSLFQLAIGTAGVGALTHWNILALVFVVIAAIHVRVKVQR